MLTWKRNRNDCWRYYSSLLNTRATAKADPVCSQDVEKFKILGPGTIDEVGGHAPVALTPRKSLPHFFSISTREVTNMMATASAGKAQPSGLQTINCSLNVTNEYPVRCSSYYSSALHKRITGYPIHLAQSRICYFVGYVPDPRRFLWYSPVSEPSKCCGSSTSLVIAVQAAAYKALQVITVTYTVLVVPVVPLYPAQPTPVAARPKTRVCGRSLAGIAGSNSAGGMDVCLVNVVCYQVQVSASGWSLLQRCV